MSDKTPEDLQVKMIVKMNTVRLVRFALEQVSPSTQIIDALNRRAMEIHYQAEAATAIKYRIKSMEENIESIPHDR